jgi:hypothetical protein
VPGVEDPDRASSPAHEGRPKEKGTAIMKLTTATQVSVDGVMQGNGPSEETRRHTAG